MDGRQRDAGTDHEAARRTARETQASSLWLRQVRLWLETLSYRPERRYMRGDQTELAPPARG